MAIASFEAIRAGRTKPSETPLPTFEAIRGAAPPRDMVFGLEAEPRNARLERMRPVLEGWKNIEDVLPGPQRAAAQVMLHQTADPWDARQTLTAQLLLAHTLDLKEDALPLMRRHWDVFVQKSFGDRISDDAVIGRLNPYSENASWRAAPEPGVFGRLWNGIKETLDGGPDIGYYRGDNRMSRRGARGPLAGTLLGRRPYDDSVLKRKTAGQAVAHGVGQAGVRMAKSLVGSVRALGELEAAGQSALGADTAMAESLGDWGQVMAESADQYLAEHPDEAMQLAPGTGFVGTTMQYLRRPELIVQGLTETAPTLLAMFAGGAVGKAVGGGLKAASYLGRVAGMASQTFGENYHTARQDGRTPEAALAQAVLQSAGEAVIEESVFTQKVGIFKTAAGQTAKQGLAKAAAEVALGAKQIAGAGKNAMLRGMGEEGLQQMNANFWAMVFDDRPLLEDAGPRLIDGVPEAMASGGILETVMSGGFWTAGKASGALSDAARLARVKRVEAWVDSAEGLSVADKKELKAVFTAQKTDLLNGRYRREHGAVTHQFRTHIKNVLGKDDTQAAVVVALADANAKRMGLSTDEFLQRYVAGVRKSDAAAVGGQQTTLWQDEEVGGYFKQHWRSMRDDYIQQHGHVVSVDDAKLLFGPVGYAVEKSNDAAYQTAAGWLANRVFDKLLKDRQGQGNGKILFMAGGSGAGKSTAVELSFGDALADYSLVVDSNLADVPSASAKIDRAIQAGFTPEIVFVYRDPQNAWSSGVLGRVAGGGRYVPMDEHLRLHEQSLKTVLELADKYGDKIDIQVLENKGTPDQITDIEKGVDFLRSIRYDIESTRTAIYEDTRRQVESGSIAKERIAEYRPPHGGSDAQGTGGQGQVSRRSLNAKGLQHNVRNVSGEAIVSETGQAVKGVDGWRPGMTDAEAEEVLARQKRQALDVVGTQAAKPVSEQQRSEALRVVDTPGQETPDLLFQEDPAAQDPPLFNSKLQSVILSKMGGAMDAEALLAMLKNNGVKDEELDWSGLRELVDQSRTQEPKNSRISKQQVLDTLAEHALEIREVEKGRVPDSEALTRELAALRDLSEAGALTDAQQQRLAELERFYTTPTRYDGYQLPGGEHYRELLLMLPETGRNDYTSQHWDEANVLAHVRYNHRTDADGKRVLLIEEIQSDWHQEGREKGYKTGDTSKTASILDTFERTYRLYSPITPDRPTSIIVGDFNTIDEANQEASLHGWIPAYNVTPPNTIGVPDAPFKKNWHELAFKRMLRYAAENGFDKIAWTPGIVQVERYTNATRQPVDRIDLVATGDETYAVMAAKGKQPVYRQEKQTAQQVRELIGKAVAEKLMGQLADGKAIATVAGDDLTVGGEGMKGFYDQILPNFVNGYVKKWGAKVASATVATGPHTSQAVHAVAITDAMVDSVLGGQWLFQDGGMTDTYRRRMIKTVKAQMTGHSIYQVFLEEAQMQAEQMLSRLGRKLDFGANLGDVKQYIDGISGKGYLWNYVSSTPGQGQPWDDYAKETAEYTHQEITDPYVFIGMLDDAILATREKNGFVQSAYERARRSGDPSFDVLAIKYERLMAGDSVEQINRRLAELAPALGASEQEMAAEMMLTEMEAAREGVRQRRKAAVEFLEDGRAIIHAFEGADLSSVVHELAHIFRRTLSDGQLAAAAQWCGATDGIWTRSAEEKFARGFERYVYDGIAPNQELQSVFAQLRQWLQEIYRRLTDSAIDIEIAPELRQVFDTMLGGGEIHPGELNFNQFMDTLGRELQNPASDWVRRYGLRAGETPNQMHKRLRADYRAQRNLQAMSEKAMAEEADLDTQLTTLQKEQLAELTQAAAQTDADVLAGQKSLRIAELLEHGITDMRLVAAVRRELKAAILAGKKEGIDKAVARWKDVQAKTRARKALREHIKALARLIAKPAPATVDLAYREAITALQAGIDPSFRTAKTLADRQRIRKLLERPDLEMPERVRAAIEKQALNDYTIAELEALAQEITRLKKQGKLKKELREEQRMRRIDQVAEQITQTLTDGKGLVMDATPVVASTRKEPWLKTHYRSLRAWTLRASRIMDILDGGKGTFDGAAHGAFIDAVNLAHDAKLRQVDARIEAGDAKLAELGMTIKDLVAVRVIDGVEYQVQEMMGIYGYALNDKSALAITFGNNISGRVLEAIRHHVEVEDPRLAELVRWMIDEFDAHFDRLEAAFVDTEQRRLVRETNYLPMRRQELDYTPDARQILNELLERAHYKKAYAEKGMTIQRIDIPDEYQKPIRLDLWGVWLEQVERQEQFIHFAALTKDLHAVVSRENVRDAVKEKLGEDYYKELRNYVSRVANPHIYKSYGVRERTSRTLRRHVAMAYLAFNLATVLKQVPGVLLYLGEVGPGRLLASAAAFIQNPKAMMHKVQAMDPQVKHTSLERVMEELRANTTLHQSLLQKIGEAGMAGIYWMDSMTRVIGWDAVYEQALAEGKSAEEALRKAQNATLRTQSAASAKDIAGIYADGETLNWFLMFSNQLNQIYNMTTYDIPRAWANGQYQRAALSMMGLGLSALTIWSISHRRLPEEPEELLAALAGESVSAIPVIGNLLTAGSRGFGGSGVAPLDQVRKLSAAAANTLDGKAGRRELDVLLETAAIAYGVPYIGPKRVVEMIENEDVTELVGGAPKKKKGKRR